MKEKDVLTVYQIRTELIHKDEDNKIQVMAIGPVNEDPIKSVLLLGQTGAGKTTVINGMINHLFRVNLEDNFRLQLKDHVKRDDLLPVESRTEYITAYIVYYQTGMPLKCNYMLIDTPGLVANREVHNQVSIKRLAIFLGNKYNIDNLNCVALVAKANENGILTYQSQMLEEFTSVLGSNISNITQLLATFASDDTCAVANVARHAQVQFVNVYQLDNWPLYVLLTDNASQKETPKFLQNRWDKMQAEYSRFFEELLNSTSVSLQQTRNLLQEYRLLEETKTALKLTVKRTAVLIDTINYQKKLLSKTADETKKITCTKIEMNPQKEKSSVIEGFHAHNCEICQKTCINFCEDPTNIAAALAGTGTGVGTAAFTGVGGAVSAGALLGAEVGIFGGPVGLAIGGGIGTVVGLTAGLTVGLLKRKTSTRCPISSRGICKSDGCSHDLAHHKVEKEKYVVFEIPEERIDNNQKLRYDDLKSQIKELETKIMINKMAVHDLENELTSGAIALVERTHKINELSMRSKAFCPLSLIDEMILGERENSQYVALLKMLRSAIILMSESQEMCNVGGEIKSDGDADVCV